MEVLYENPNFLSVCEFLPNHLYFVTVQNINNGGSCEAVISHTDDLHFFSTDTELMYHNFYGDFGPLNITCLYKFCKKLTNKLAACAGDAFLEKLSNSRFGRQDIIDKLQEKFVRKKVIVYYTSTNNEKRANAAFLISSFALLYLGFSPRMAYKALQPHKMRYRAFQDASVGLSPHKINLKDCLDALHKASAFGFFNFCDFNVNECSYYENTEHGDISWIVPQKFLAFPAPVEEKSDYYHHPNFYIEYFLCNNVTDVIRLNQKTYDAKCFTLFDIRHHDLLMQDGADPPDAILKRFMSIAERATGAIAVHCKAGLGRTGTLIGAYLLKHYRMTPKEAIAWIRICRPGSVIGHQQTWLESQKDILWHQGNEWRYKMYGKTEIVPYLPCGIYSLQSPKKEFPGLRELLVNLTKRSRYRFVVKNQSKSSKTKLLQMVRTILASGKFVNEKIKEKDQKGLTSSTTSARQSEGTQLIGQHNNFDQPIIPSLRDMESSKNLHYLKPPPSIGNENAIEYPKHEAVRNFPKSTMSRMDNPEQKAECYNPNMYYPSEGKQTAMYSNPNSFCSHSRGYEDYEYSHNSYSENKHFPCAKQEERSQNFPTMPKSRSERMTTQTETACKNLDCKSVDKNWKQNTQATKYYKNYGESNNAQYKQEDVCPFDTRAGTLSHYSWYNRQCINRNFQEREIYASDLHPGEEKTCSKQRLNDNARSTHGFLLSPEDLQSWIETFDGKCGETQGDNRNELRKSKMTSL